MEKGWVRQAPSEREADVLCIATFLPVRRWRSVISFLRLSLRIEQQLKNSPGLLRYSLRTNLPRKQFWTLSVWTDRRAMSAFVSLEPHATAVKKFEQWAGPGAAFAEWETQNPSFAWSVALERLTHPTFYYQPSGS